MRHRNLPTTHHHHQGSKTRRDIRRLLSSTFPSGTRRLDPHCPLSARSPIGNDTSACTRSLCLRWLLALILHTRCDRAHFLNHHLHVARRQPSTLPGKDCNPNQKADLRVTSTRVRHALPPQIPPARQLESNLPRPRPGLALERPDSVFLPRTHLLP